MENKKQSWIRIAEVLLGVLLGAVLTLTVVRYRESRRILSAKYVEWRKLNLILDEIEKNYVDTIDQAGMRSGSRPTRSWPAISRASASSSTCRTTRPSCWR